MMEHRHANEAPADYYKDVASRQVLACVSGSQSYWYTQYSPLFSGLGQRHRLPASPIRDPRRPLRVDLWAAIRDGLLRTDAWGRRAAVPLPWPQPRPGILEKPPFLLDLIHIRLLLPGLFPLLSFSLHFADMIPFRGSPSVRETRRTPDVPECVDPPAPPVLR